MNRYISRYLFYYPATMLKGEQVGRSLKAAREFQWLSPDEIAEYQLGKALHVLHWAVKNSRYYRHLYRGIDLQSIRSLSDLAQLPTIGKTDLIDGYPDIVTDLGGSSEVKTTGGSTGHPVRIIKNADALAMERAVTWRGYEWAGVSVGDPQGRFWGVPHTRKARLRAQIADLVANRRRISAFDLNKESLERYYKELSLFQPRYLYGYVSVVEALANHIRDYGLAPIPGVKSVITTSEVLSEASRSAIEAAFKVKVFNEYGCGEVGSIAHECEHGSMHIMADNLLLEVDGSRVDGAKEGEIIVTDFFNLKTPMLRYRVGDYGRLSGKNCVCGRGLPVLDNVYGRAYDLIRLKNGAAIHPESLIYVVEDFKSESDAIAQFQAVQTSEEKIDIFVVPKASWSPILAERLEACMKSKLSLDISYRIQAVDALQREPSGKMRVVKSCVAPPVSSGARAA